MSPHSLIRSVQNSNINKNNLAIVLHIYAQCWFSHTAIVKKKLEWRGGAVNGLQNRSQKKVCWFQQSSFFIKHYFFDIPLYFSIFTYSKTICDLSIITVTLRISIGGHTSTKYWITPEDLETFAPQSSSCGRRLKGVYFWWKMVR